MTENPTLLEQIIEDLNHQFSDQTGENGTTWSPFEARLYTGEQGIFFFGEPIWQSEDEERRYNEKRDQYEPLAKFIVREVNQRLKEWSKVRLKTTTIQIQKIHETKKQTYQETKQRPDPGPERSEFPG